MPKQEKLSQQKITRISRPRKEENSKKVSARYRAIRISLWLYQIKKAACKIEMARGECQQCAGTASHNGMAFSPEEGMFGQILLNNGIQGAMFMRSKGLPRKSGNQSSIPGRRTDSKELVSDFQMHTAGLACPHAHYKRKNQEDKLKF